MSDSANISDSVLRAQVANILKKSKDGKVLSAREERILVDWQESQNQKHEKKTWVKGGKDGLARRMGVERKSVQRWSKFADYPKTRANGDYCLEDCIAWVHEHGFKGGEKSSMQELKERELAAKVAKIEFELDVEKGKYILVSDAERETTILNNDTKNILRAKFEGELPPMLEGVSAAEIQDRCKRAVDEVCERLSK